MQLSRSLLAFGSTVAKDLQTLMLTRFFRGFFSSAPTANMGGVLADLSTCHAIRSLPWSVTRCLLLEVLARRRLLVVPLQTVVSVGAGQNM